MMPTLLQINSTSNWGSTGKIAEQIGVLAKQDGWDVYVAYGRHANASELPTYRIGGRWDNRWHFLWSRYLDCEGKASHRATKRLCARIDEIKPDIVHMHNIHGHYLNYKMLVQHINKRHIPVVWTLHDSWIMTGHCYLFGGTGCQKWKTECHDCPMKQTFCPDRSTQNYRRKKEVFTSMENVHLVAVSRWLENVVAESYMKDFPHQTIYNGIDLKVFSPRENDVKEALGLTGKHIILAVASAWSESKGLKDYITLSELLPQDCTIVLVGLTQEQKDALPERIKGIPLTQTQAELVELYTAADVVLSLSKGESFGLTPVEGMACGVPAVVYANGALPELVDDKTGIVVKEGDMTGLINAIGHFTGMNEDLRQQTKKCCLERAASLFDKNNNFSEYISLYNRVLIEKLIGGGKVVLGLATAWDSRKGLADYIKLAGMLPKEYLIVLVGVTEEIKASLPRNIVGIGRTSSQADLAALYLMAEVVTSLSVSESLGMTPIEGMACGTPAIVYDNTAQPELVTPETGVVVKTGDVEAVKEAVVQITDKGKAHYVEACRQRAEMCFDKNKNYLEYIKLYHTIIKE